MLIFSVKTLNDVKESDYRYAETVEEISSKAESRGFNVARHYYANDGMEDYPQQWYEDRLKVSRLNNGNLKTYAGGFAETFLKKENGGCVGIFASSIESNTDHNNYIAIGMFKSIWNECFDSRLELDMIHDTTHDTRLGVLLNQGLAQLRNVYGVVDEIYSTQQYYYCFGDPSMRMYSGVPASISTKVTTSLVDGNTFKYSFNIPTGCRASVYNVTQDSVIVFDMLKGSVTFPKNDDISICFTGDNIRCLQWSNVQTVRPPASRIMESNIMVREDRIWEHYGFDGSIWTEWFEGTTEINGKTYHNFHLRDVKPDNSEVELLIAYMREDAGKVYMIASELTPLQQKIFGSAFYRNYEDELLVYDFNLNKDDVMLMTQDPIVQSSKIWPLTTGEYQNVHYITDKFVLEYQGKTFDTYEVTVIYPYNGHKWQYEVIKGVGGFQSAMCFPVLSSRYDCIEGKLHRVKLYDLDRNLLFDSYGAQMLSATDVEADGGVNFDGKVIRIDEAGADCRVDIYDTCGSLVRSNAGEACAETSLDGLARGVYIVRVSGTTNGCTAMKINI